MKNKRLLSVICSVAIAIFVSWLINKCITSKPEYPITELDEGWTVTLNGVQHKDVKLTEFYKILGDRKIMIADEVVMTKTLPETDNYPFPVLLFRSRYSTIECFLGDEKIFDYGLEMYRKKQFIGKKYHFISLPMEYSGKRLTIRMTASENDAFSAFAPIKLGSQPDVESDLIHQHMAIIATGMFLFIFGISFLCITLFFVASTPDIISLLIGSVFSMNIGVWIMCYYNMLSPFFHTDFETQMEYFTLYLIVPYCYLMFYFIQKIENKTLYLSLAGISTLIPIIQYVLHYAFNIHLRATLPMYHIEAVLGFGLLVYYLIRNIRRKDISPSGVIQMAGITAFAAAEISHLVVYLMDSLHIPHSYFIGIMSIDSGCLIYVMCQLANYMLYVTQSYAQRKENASLTHLAYADGLTNMANRARADKLMDDLDKTDSDYCIISVDLNGLKTVNDTFGHLSGDKYIKDFSKVLTTTFGEDGICARIGGDEFLVIIQDATDKDIDGLISRMTSALNVMNTLYTEYHRSVASGYAYRHECPEGSPSHEVYLLADQRMYEIKRKMHEELGIKNRL